MIITPNVKVLQEHIDITKLRDVVLSIPEEEWDENPIRQQKFDTAKDTKAVIMKFNGPLVPSGDNPRKTDTFPPWEKYKHLVEPVINPVLDCFPPGILNKCMFARLKAGGEIGVHTDSNYTLGVSHRLHIPLVTNDDVIFMIDGVDYNLKESKGYEINNVATHGVKNNSDTDRIHLLFDYFCPPEGME